MVLFIGVVFLNTLAANNDLEREELGKAFMNEANAENLIGLYLKQPVEVNNEILTMADFTVLAALNKGDYRQAWEDFTYDFFYTNQMKTEIRVYLGKEKRLEQKVVTDFWKAAKQVQYVSPTDPQQGVVRWLYDLFKKDEHSISTSYLPSPSGTLRIEIRKFYQPWN